MKTRPPYTTGDATNTPPSGAVTLALICSVLTAYGFDSGDACTWRAVRSPLCRKAGQSPEQAPGAVPSAQPTSIWYALAAVQVPRRCSTITVSPSLRARFRLITEPEE